MGRCEPSTGLEPVGRWVRPVRAQAPYRSADRVLWVVDHGSAPRGQAAVRRLMAAYPHAMLVQTPGPASWLHQVDIDCSLVQRTVLTPKDVARLVAGEQRLRLSEDLCHPRPRPFQGKFTREKLLPCLDRLDARRATQSHAHPVPAPSKPVA
jgi:hypothetical protein